MKRLSRRTVLKGMVGGATVSLALPPLEAMLDSNGAHADETDDGPFFGVFFWANGMPWHAAHGAEQAMGGYPDLWTPAAEGPSYQPSQLLAPLASHRVSLATGLQPTTQIPQDPPGQGDGHMRGFMVALTGDRPRSEGFDHGSHTLTALRPSIDQYIAHHPSFYGTPPRFRSLVVGVSGARFHDYGHWNAISYNGPSSTNQPIMRPSSLFDHVFAVPAEAAEVGRRSLALDAVLEDARRLKQYRLGEADRARVDEHIEHISAIQRRLDASQASCDEPNRPTDSTDLMQKTEEMATILATAISCGMTRVFSFMLTSPASTHIFSNLGVPNGMHKTCHDGEWESVRKITLHQMQAFARFLDAFDAIQHPAGGTLLDRACIFGTSEYGEGWKHGVKEFPTIIAGGAAGAVQRGVHVRDQGGSVSRAHLTVLRALGLPDTSFGFNGGETSSVLSELLA